MDWDWDCEEKKCWRGEEGRPGERGLVGRPGDLGLGGRPGDLGLEGRGGDERGGLNRGVWEFAETAEMGSPWWEEATDVCDRLGR